MSEALVIWLSVGLFCAFLLFVVWRMADSDMRFRRRIRDIEERHLERKKKIKESYNLRMRK